MSINKAKEKRRGSTIVSMLEAILDKSLSITKLLVKLGMLELMLNRAHGMIKG